MVGVQRRKNKTPSLSVRLQPGPTDSYYNVTHFTEGCDSEALLPGGDVSVHNNDKMIN